MSKFLDLVVESTPSEGKGPFTIEYKDVDGILMAKAKIPDNVGSSYDNFIKFVEMSNGSLHVVDKAETVEDQEVVSGVGEYNVDDEVYKLAAKAKSGPAGLVGKVFKTGAQKAKKAVKRREKVAELSIDRFNQNTDELEQKVVK